VCDFEFIYDILYTALPVNERAKPSCFVLHRVTVVVYVTTT